MAMGGGAHRDKVIHEECHPDSGDAIQEARNGVSRFFFRNNKIINIYGGEAIFYNSHTTPVSSHTHTPTLLTARQDRTMMGKAMYNPTSKASVLPPPVVPLSLPNFPSNPFIPGAESPGTTPPSVEARISSSVASHCRPTIRWKTACDGGGASSATTTTTTATTARRRAMPRRWRRRRRGGEGNAASLSFTLYSKGW